MKTKDTILFSGGGMRGVVFLGVMKYLEENNCEISNYYGVSVGSMFAFLMCIGFGADELKEIVVNKNFTDLCDINLKSFLTKFGLDTGNNIIKWIEETMSLKNILSNITFLDLYKRTDKKLTIFASNIVTSEMKCFDYKSTPTLRILDAIRMSMSIPLIFTPKKLNSEIHVDGAVVNNFPIDLVEEDQSRCLYFKLNKKLEPKLIDASVFTYIIQVFNCYVQARRKVEDREKLKDYDIIEIETNIMDTINFDMSKDRKEELIRKGYHTIKNFFGDVKNNE